MISQRKRLRRFYHKGAVYFISTYTEDRYPYFNEPIFCELLSEQIMLGSTIKCYNIYAYVILPEHIHLLIQPEGEYNISNIIHSIKRNSSRYINHIIDNNPVREIYKSPLRVSENIMAEIIEFEKHLRSLIIRFWDKYTTDGVLAMPRFQWHKSFHDHMLRDNEDIRDYYEYIINNPVKESLVDDPLDYKWIYIRESDDFRGRESDLDAR